MATAKFDITPATRPLYAGVGVTDRAVEAFRGSLAQSQKRINDVQQDARQIDLDTVTREAKARRAAVEARITDLQQSLQSVPSRIQARITAELNERELTYGQLVDRGETLVERIRRQGSTQETKRNARTTSSKAKTTRTQGTKAAGATGSQAKGAAKSTATTAKNQAASTAEAAKGSAKSTATAATSGARSTRTTAKKQSSRPSSSAKATGTAARKTASSATKATKDAASKVGD